MAERMDSDAFSAWLDLSRLRPNGPKGGPGTISMPEDLAEHEILHSRYSDFAEFHDGGDLDAARAEPGVDVLLHAGDSPVLLAYPSSDQNSYAVRRITQNFRLLSPGGDPAGDLQRRQLFQSAVSWLIECPQCPLSDLQILSLSASPEEPKAGQELILEAHLTHSGACDPTGVSFSTWIPEGSRLVATSPSNAIRIGNELVFRLGRQPNGFHTNITVTLVPAAAGTLRLRGCLSGSTPDAFASDNCRDWVVPVNPGAIDLPQVLPRLAISRTNGGLRIRVEGASDQPYELQYRDASGSWIPEAISPQTTPSGVSFMVNSTSETRLYRVRVR